MCIHYHRHERCPRRCSRRKPRRLRRETPPNSITSGKNKMTRLALDKANKKILGVCAGLANWSGMDPMVVRLIFAVLTLVGFGSPILIYILLAMILD